MTKDLFRYRFEIFFYSLLIILFGILVFPKQLFYSVLMPTLFIINFATGLIIFKKRRNQSIITLILIVFSIVILVYRAISHSEDQVFEYIKFFVYFIFYVLITFEIISQVWHAKRVNSTVIYGLMSGYISLGFIGFFIFCCIEMVSPNAFAGLSESGLTPANIDDLMYYSYISLMTIGFGDITPVANSAQKATMFISLVGQFYLVIFTAVIVGKYLKYSEKT